MGDDRPAVLSNSWRKPLVVDAWTGKNNALENVSLGSRSGRLEGTHAFAVNPSGGACVLGSAVGPKNSSTMSIVELNQNGHSVLASHQVEHPITCLHWSKGGMLASGSNKGRLHYWMGVNNDTVKQLNTDSRISLAAPKMRETAATPVAAGGWTYNSCLTQVQTVRSEKVILGSENIKIHLWDVETQTHLKGIKVSSGVVQAFSCSPESDFIIATGSSTSGMKIIDTRTTKPVLRTQNSKAIRQIAMSPLVGHWVASTSDGGDIKIWDIRGGANSIPVLTMPHHEGVTAGLEWSPFHSELIAIGGVCGSVRLYSCRHPPDFCISSVSLGSPFVGVSFIGDHSSRSTESPVSTIVAASSSGEITSVDLSPIFMDNLVQYRKLDDASERLAYLRNLREAEQRIRVTLTNKIKSNDLKSALQVASLLHNHIPKRLNKDSTPQQFLNAFKIDMDCCTKQLPPLMRFNPSTILKNLELNLTIADWAANKEHHLVVKKITDLLQPSDSVDEEDDDENETLTANLLVSLTPEIYETIVGSLTKHTWSVGCDFVLRTALQAEDLLQLEPPTLISIITYLIGNNVKQPTTISESLERLGLIREISQLTVECGSDAAKHIINVVNDYSKSSPISVLVDTSVVQMYASSLMFVGRTSQCVWFVDAFGKKHSGTVADYTREILNRIVACVISRYSSKLVGEKNRIDQKKSAVKGRAFVQGMVNTISFASEMAVTCRMLIEEAFKNDPMPTSPGPFYDVLQLAATSAEEMRAIVTKTLRQVDALGAAVRQECRPIVARYAGDLSSTINEAPRRDFNTEPTMKQLLSSSFGHCEVLLTLLNNHLEEE